MAQAETAFEDLRPGERIRTHRDRLDLSQAELGALVAKLAELERPVSEQTVARWEKGLILPRGDELIGLSKAFNVSTDYLLGLKATGR